MMTRVKSTNRPRVTQSGGVARGLIPDWLDAIFLRTLVPAIRRLVIARVDPNWLTVLAFLLTVGASTLIVLDRMILAFVCIVLGGVFDFVDGKVAVLTGRVTKAGAVLDSALDRYSDIAVYVALIVYFGVRSHPVTALAAVLALFGSMMTSYMMALGKSHGIDFRIGVLRRQDRVMLISVGLAFTPLHAFIERGVIAAAAAIGIPIDILPLMPLAAVVYMLAVFSNVTALQRLVLLLKVVDRGSDHPGTANERELSLREKQLAMLEREIGTGQR